MNTTTRILKYEDGFNIKQRLRGFEVVSKYSKEEESIKNPKRATKFSAGYDIFNNGEAIELQPGEISQPITTKLKSYMLGDEVLLLLPRSGHGFKYSVRLCNTIGVIDSDYYNNKTNEGEIKIRLHNQGHHAMTIPSGEAMAQGIFIKYLTVDDDSADGVREGGFGSTSQS